MGAPAVGRSGSDGRLADTEATALAGRTAHFDAGAVRIADGFHDREAEAGAALVTRARAVDTEEAFEDVGERFGRYPDAVVSNVEDGAALLLRDLEFDATAVGSVFDRVVEQIDNDLFESRP